MIIYALLLLFLLSCENNKDNFEPVAYSNPVVLPFTQALKENPEDADLYFRRAEALNQINADSLSIVDLKKAIELDAKNPQYYQALGMLYLNNNQADQAVVALEQNLELSPGEVRVRLLLSKAYLESSQIKKAQEQVDKVLAADPDYPEALCWNGQIKATEKDTVAAIQYIKKALEINPAFYSASYQLADLYAAQKNENAVAQYHKTFNMDTLNVAPLFDIGEFYKNKKEWEQAKKAYVQSVLKDPDYSFAYIEIGKILMLQDSLNKALRQFNLAVITKPGFAEAFYNKGLCFEKLNQKDSAEAAFKQALVYNSKLKEAEAGIKRMNAAE